jgi:hypothetical protein
VVFGPVVTDSGALGFYIATQHEDRFSPATVSLPKTEDSPAASLREGVMLELWRRGMTIHDCEDIPSLLTVCRELWPCDGLMEACALFERETGVSLSVDAMESTRVVTGERLQ